jgi:hypothetical protein
MERTAAEKAALESQASPTGRRRGIFAFLQRNVTPRFGAALVLWRVEARLSTPVALALVATLGRWPGALVMGTIMAVFSAVFLFLLDGERVMDELRAWVRTRRLLRRYLLPIAERRDVTGTIQRAVALPATVMFMGPFPRAGTYHLFRTPRVPAYALSVGGSFPHSLLWTGLILGGLWELVYWPFLDDMLWPFLKSLGLF